MLNTKKKLDELQFQFQKAEQEGNLNLAAKIRHGQIPEIQTKIDSLDVSWKLNKDAVAEVTAKITGIPKENILRTSYENLIQLENSLKKRIFGQDKSHQRNIRNFTLFLSGFIGSK